MTYPIVRTHGRFSEPGRAATRRSHARALPALLWAALLVAGCGSDSSRVALELVAPSRDQILTQRDDKDPDRSGLQFDVEANARGIDRGTTINLFIDDEQQAVTGRIGDEGKVTLADVTLPPGTHTIYLETSTGSASSSKDHEYTLKALNITAPDNGATLTMDEDEDPTEGGVQISVEVKAFAIESTEEISLFLDDDEVGQQRPDADDGMAVFSGITLINGSHTLKATTGDGDELIESGEVEIHVRDSCAAVTFLTPEPPADGEDRISLGGNTCPAPMSGDPFTTTVSISTDAGNGRPVQLFVNGQPVMDTTVAGATATFQDVVLGRRSSANQIEVSVENSEGVTCRSSFPGDVFVDCDGASCTIKSPTPVSFTDDNNDVTLFLNAALRDNEGFDVEVESGSELDGREVELVVDGNSRNALSATAEADGDLSIALFDDVLLDEGPHTIEALCTDAAGNITSSGEHSWIVDVTACSVAVTDPVADTLFVPGDDEDNASSGTQVVVASTVEGDDCSGQRARVCDPNDGIADAAFVPYDGTSPLLSTITLDEAGGQQSLCVEVQDHAANVGLGSVEIAYRANAPRVLIESPDDGDRYNRDGGSGFVVDADDSTAGCEAVFSVACSDVGADVDLHHDDAGGAVFASGECVEPSGGPALPAGYAGRAEITAFFEDGDQTAVIVATQTVDGESGEDLIGESAAVTLEGDCRGPTLLFQGQPCGPSGQLSLAQAAALDIVVNDVVTDLDSASLSFTRQGGGGGDATPSATTSNSATFSDVDLGAEDTVEIVVTVEDDFGNSDEISCTTQIVNDLPVINSVSSPANGATFGPGDGCNTGTAGQFGVRVTAEVDTATNRVASVLVNGVAVATTIDVVPAAGHANIDECIPVPDDMQNATPGASMVTLRLEADVGIGLAEVTRTVDVNTLAIAAPAANSVLLAAANCAGSGFGFPVVVDVDPIHMGAGYTLTGDAGNVTGVVGGAQITGCVPLDQGPNTITASIGAIAYSVPVTVASVAPTTGIVIDALPAPDPVDPAHRDGITASWPEPTEDYPGQLLSYALRCDSTAIVQGESTVNKTNWWNAADAVTLPTALTPDDSDPSAVLAFRPEDPRHCVVRAADAGGQLTPIEHSTDLTLKLRQRVISSGASAIYLGFSVRAAGDVDGDGIGDLIAGGQGRAELIFGNTDLSALSKVVFTGAGGGVGTAAIGLGDFNGDGMDDFAITDANMNGFAGRTSVFFGRPRAEWPATSIDLESACNADLCLDGTDASTLLGFAASSAGDFDGDGTPDLALGAPYYPGFTGDGRIAVVLGDAYETRPCTECRAGETCSASTCQRAGGETFWKLRFALPSGDSLDPVAGSDLRGFWINAAASSVATLGTSVAGLGNFDGAPGDDIAIGAPGDQEVLYLSGRSHPGPGMTMLALTDLGLPVAGVPSGAPIASSAAATFGTVLASVGDFYAAPGAAGAASDLAVGRSTADFMYVLPGDPLSAVDPGFSANEISIQVIGNIGTSIANSVDPVLGLLGDLDGDGEPELCGGTRNVVPHNVWLWYPDRFAAGLSGNSTDAASGGAIPLIPVTANTAELIVQYVGDFNDDGHLDLAVGDWRANAFFGQVVLLY